MRQSESTLQENAGKTDSKTQQKKKKLYIIKFESKQQVHESIKAVRIQEKKETEPEKRQQRITTTAYCVSGN